MGMTGEGVWELPAGWEASPLGCLVEIQSGFACSKKNLVPAGEGVAHLRPFNVATDGKVDLSEVYYIPRDFKDNVKDYALEVGHVLFNNTNSVELVGKSALVTQPMACAFSNHIYRLAVEERAKKRLEPAWLALALRRLWAMGYFAEQCNRWIGQAGFSATKLQEVEVPLPPLDEQRRIVSRIEALFERIIEAQRLRIAAEEDAKRFTTAVLGEIFPDPENGLPESWQIRRVAEISEKPQYGYTQSSKDEPVGPKFLRITDIQNGEVNWETVPYCLCDDKVRDKYRLEPGDIVFARSGATTGKTFLVDECPEAVFASYLIRLKIRQTIPGYVYWFFQSPYYWDQVQPRGAAQPNMNARILSDLKVPIPSLAEQRRIVAYLDSVQAQVDELRRLQAASAAELARLEGAVLARAFKGEL